MNDGPISFAKLRRRAEAIPGPDLHDYVPAIRAMQETLSPEVVLALVEAVEAARDLRDHVEESESVGVCLPERVPSLILGDKLARFDFGATVAAGTRAQEAAKVLLYQHPGNHQEEGTR